MTKRANPPPLSRSLVQDNVPAKVTDRLWIGSIHAAFNQDSMQDRGITHVLNASGLPATFPRQFTYFTVDIRDKESSNILTAIGAVNIFVEAGIEKGGVLVHCAGGRSRSAAFVVAFIMSTQGCSYDAAYAQVRRARPVASVNRGFEQQLRAYGAAQCNVFAAHQMMLRIRAAALLDRRNLLLLRRSSGVTPSETVGDGAEGGEAAEHTRTSPTRPSAQHQLGARGAAAAAGAVEMKQPKTKGVSSLIEVANPNAKPKAGRMMKAKDMDMAAAPVELSRREREAVEAQRKKDHYMKLHAEGKTQEAQVDMARLALVRKRREEAEARKAEEAAAEGASGKAKMEKEARAKAGSGGPQKLNPLEVKKMNPTRLKELLKERDESLQGSKKDLIARLLAWEKTNQS